MKRRHTFAWIALAVSLLSVTAFGREESLDGLLQRADAAKPGDRGVLYAKAIQQEIELANQQFTAGDAEKAQATIGNIVAHTDKCREDALGTGKHLKDIDVRLREAARRLDDIGHTLAFDDQPPVKAAVQKLQDLRSDILDRMFAPPNKEKKKK